MDRPATWATMGRFSAAASSNRPSTSRHTSGALSGWLTLMLMVTPVRRASSTIHGHSRSGTSAWSGANWNTPCPTLAMASPMAISSSESASVPGTSSPDLDRWSGVRLVENPSAPARSASSTSLAIDSRSSAVASSLSAPRSPIT